MDGWMDGWMDVNFRAITGFIQRLNEFKYFFAFPSFCLESWSISSWFPVIIFVSLSVFCKIIIINNHNYTGLQNFMTWLPLSF